MSLYNTITTTMFFDTTYHNELKCEKKSNFKYYVLEWFHAMVARLPQRLKSMGNNHSLEKVSKIALSYQNGLFSTF